jgi:hypothetical protein
MNTININDNLFNFKSNLGKKSEKPKPGRSAKLHRTDDYWLKMHNAERRKQTKVRHDTHRREEQPDAKELRLEDIHFGNFLGSKDINGIPYNNAHIDEPVNIIECDMYLKAEPSKNVAEEEQPEEEGDTFNYGSWAPQISREPNTKWHMNLHYEPETQSLNCYSTIKRGRDEEEEEQTAKRLRSESDEISRMEEGLLEQQQEVANFEAMVAYMRQQVQLAQQMMEDELTPCDCCR